MKNILLFLFALTLIVTMVLWVRHGGGAPYPDLSTAPVLNSSELEQVLEAEAVLIGSAEPRDAELRDQLLRRIDGVLAAARYTLLEYNCPADRIDEATAITPGFSSGSCKAWAM